MAIEIAPKVKIRIFLPVIILGIIWLLLFLVLLLSYIYFSLNIKKTSQALQEKEAIVAPLDKAIQEKEIELMPFSQKLNDFNKLLSGHKKITNTFELLEKVSLPKVFFSDFSFNSQTRELLVSGQADSFATLEHQISVLKKELLIKDFKISEVSMGEEGEILFNLQLSL